MPVPALSALRAAPDSDAEPGLPAIPATGAAACHKPKEPHNENDQSNDPEEVEREAPRTEENREEQDCK
jgi:hypothetical protein